MLRITRYDPSQRAAADPATPCCAAQRETARVGHAAAAGEPSHLQRRERAVGGGLLVARAGGGQRLGLQLADRARAGPSRHRLQRGLRCNTSRRVVT